MGSRSLLKRRLQRLERAPNAAEKRCIFCEQEYWTMVSVNDAVGRFSKTQYGYEVGRVVSRVLEEARTGETPEYLAHLPAFNLEKDLEEEHEGVMQAVHLVRESRPARIGCECVEAWEILWRIKARILYHYPAVAEATIQYLQRYAASPPDERIIYHFAAPRLKCACTPSDHLTRLNTSVIPPLHPTLLPAPGPSLRWWLSVHLSGVRWTAKGGGATSLDGLSARCLGQYPGRELHLNPQARTLAPALVAEQGERKGGDL